MRLQAFRIRRRVVSDPNEQETIKVTRMVEFFLKLNEEQPTKLVPIKKRK